MKSLELSERQIQSLFMQWVEVQYPPYRQLLIHIPNEGKRSLAEGRRQKELGLMRGVSDLFFAYPIVNGQMQHYCGLWLEMKKKSGRETKEQISFRERMLKQGYQAKVAHSFDEAREIFEEYIR
jgi:hypothetical protein